MLKQKIKTPLELKRILSTLKNKGKRVVFSNGCFDLLHYGHVAYLETARKRGDILVVALNSDKSIRRLKGPTRPIVSQNDRAATVAGLQSVDFVTIFGQDTPLELIKLLKPDVLIKGADWDKRNIVGAEFLRRYGGKVATVKLLKGRSTTNIIKKIVKIS